MNKKLIERLREWCSPDEPPIDEAADALEVADKRIEQLTAYTIVLEDNMDYAKQRLEQLEADCEMKDKRIDWTVADNAKKAIRIEHLEADNAVCTFPWVKLQGYENLTRKMGGAVKRYFVERANKKSS